MTSNSSETLNDPSVESIDYYKHLSLFWTDIIHLMSSKPQALTSIGPMRAFAANSKKISVELIEINEKLFEFNDIDFNDIIVSLGDTAETTLQDKLDGIKEQIAKIDDQKNYLNQKEKLRILANQTGGGSLRTTQIHQLKLS